MAKLTLSACIVVVLSYRDKLTFIIICVWIHSHTIDCLDFHQASWHSSRKMTRVGYELKLNFISDS